MGKDLTMDRATLLRAATLVRPALAERAYIPALTHIALDGSWATAYDDALAISVQCDTDFNCLVPGLLFMQSLSSFGSKEVLVQEGEGAHIVLRGGRGRVKLPTLQPEAFPLQWPRDPIGTVTIEGDMLKAMERCLISVNTDATQPAQMGITLDSNEDGHAVFFSTDNNSISRAQCAPKIKLPGDVPIILPRRFCEQLLALSKAFPDTIPSMDIGDGYVDVAFLKPARGHAARLFARMVIDLDPIDFPRTLTRHCGELATLKKRTAVVPEELDQALDRALLVLASETRKRTVVKVDDGTLKLRATSELGDADDHMKIDLDDVGPVDMDAFYVARGLKHADRIAITDKVTILVGGESCEFLHIVLHVRDTK